MNHLDVIHKKWKIYRNLEKKRGFNFNTFSIPELQETKQLENRIGITRETGHTVPMLDEAMNQHLSRETGCLNICITQNLQVVKAYGDTGKFLLQRHFTTDLNELLPKQLAVALSTLVRRVLSSGKRASATGISINMDNAVVKVSLAVNLLDINSDEKLLTAIFKEESKIPLSTEDTIFDEQLYLGQYTKDLEKEIKTLNDKLKSSYERLDATNENMQSFNEELVSANEEMQSTNEEMQSVNEELHTINADYQLKNKELLEINDDLNNYFRSNINGQLFINDKLELMKFSPGAVKQINLQESDIGRPLSHISTNIKLETMIEDIKEVLAEGIVVTKEIETTNGKWYQSMTMPYVRQADNKNIGAILTFNDITAVKAAQHDLHQKNKMLLRINADLENFIHAASHDLLAPLGNIETSIGIMNSIAMNDAKLNDFLSMINTSVRKFRELITDIATIAKVEGDMIQLEEVDLDEVISNIEWSMQDKILASNAVIIRDLKVQKVFFSKKNLRSIVYNLVSNAIKFTGLENPVVHISTKPEAENVVLSVRDNGKGIPAASIEQIFDMYGRLNQDIEGHGIGLYLAKKIVNSAGGSIVVESEPGVGTLFSIYLKIEA